MCVKNEGNKALTITVQKKKCIFLCKVLGNAFAVILCECAAFVTTKKNVYRGENIANIFWIVNNDEFCLYQCITLNN